MYRVLIDGAGENQRRYSSGRLLLGLGRSQWSVWGLQVGPDVSGFWSTAQSLPPAGSNLQQPHQSAHLVLCLQVIIIINHSIQSTDQSPINQVSNQVTY